MTDSVHCSHCAAPFREEDARFCSFCGTERPALAHPIVLAPTAPERYAAADRHPSVAELSKRSPSTAAQAFGGVFGIVFMIVFCLIAAVIAGGILSVGGFACHALDQPAIGVGAGVFGLVPLLILGAGIVGLVLIVVRFSRFQSATLERSIVVVVDKRTQTSGDFSTNYATVETKDRERREYKLDARSAGRVVLHDMGMAYVKDDVLLDFQRIDV